MTKVFNAKTMEYEEVMCAICGKQLSLVSKWKHKYCSNKCSHVAAMAQEDARKKALGIKVKHRNG